MISEAQISIRNAGLILGQRGLHILGSLLLAILVPRIMGPDTYGRYVLVTSLSLWFLVLADPGLVQVMGRYIPPLILQGDKAKLQKLVGNFLIVSWITGAISGCLYLLFTGLWLTELDLLLLIVPAITILARASTHPFYTLFLGLNQAARWGMAEIFRQWFSIILVIIGFYISGLQGALLGLFLTELVVLSIGVWWGKPYCSKAEMHLDLPYLIPYLRFGLIFFISHFLSSAFMNSGVVLIRFFYTDYVQVSYFGLANSIHFGISFAIPQFALAFAPLLVTLQARGETKVLTQWVEYLINWLTIGGLFVVFGVLLLGKDLVPLILGAAYQPVATNLLPLSIALWLQVLSSVAFILTIVYNRPGEAVIASGIRLAAFWCLGPLLAARWGSLGGCFAFLGASIFHAGYLTWRMRGILRYSLKKWGWIVVLGLLFVPLAWLRSSWPVNVALYGTFVTGYGTLLLLLRFITASEVVTVWRAFNQRARSSVRKEA
jgi:O-antigen/teichoic acid export membrane protein